MSRVKGSKNKPKHEELPKDDDLLGDCPAEDVVKEDVQTSEEKPKRLVGLHPITGMEVWI